MTNVLLEPMFWNRKISHYLLLEVKLCRINNPKGVYNIDEVHRKMNTFLPGNSKLRAAWKKALFFKGGSVV